MTTEAQPAACEPTPARWFEVMRRQPAAFLTAVRFLTRLPISDTLFPADVEPAVLLRDSVIYFPLVGSLIGLATTGVIVGAATLYSAWLAVFLGLALEALLTGALHEDGVADFCDAFGGGWTREDVLRILKDSRVGSFGVLGLMFAVLLRAGALIELAPAAWALVAVLVASTTLGRWVMLLALTCCPPVPERESTSRDVGQHVGWRDLAWGTVLALPGVVLMALTLPIVIAVAFVGLVIVGLFFCSYLRRRIGGVTGDCLGFLCYVGQLLVLLTAAARIPW